MSQRLARPTPAPPLYKVCTYASTCNRITPLRYQSLKGDGDTDTDRTVATTEVERGHLRQGVTAEEVNTWGEGGDYVAAEEFKDS